MNKQELYPMSNEIALELIRQWIKPNNPSLAGLFNWSQPNEGDNITLGDCYGLVGYGRQFTIREILFQDIYKGGGVYQNELTVSLECAKTALRAMDLEGIKRDSTFQIDGIYDLVNPSIEFIKLDRDQKCLYRLSILWLNSMLELHNWAVEYLQYLATYHCNGYDKQWRLYEECSKGDNIYNAILECEENPLGINIEDYGNPYYHYDDKIDSSILESLKEINENDENYFTSFFGIQDDNLRNWELEEILSILALSVEQVKSLWHNGDLELSYSEEIESKVLRDFIRMYEAQLILPGLES